MPEKLKPYFEDVQAHYDLSDEFFRLWLDPSQTYSCAYFERDDMSLEEALLAKIDLALGKLGLQPGMTLLDIGCGWGATIMRALERYDVNVMGLTMSKNQYDHVEQLFAESDSPRSKRIELKGWEEFDEQVDRIVSIGAFEHFDFDRYDDFFTMANKALPDDGVMLLHTITALTLPQMAERGIAPDDQRGQVREVHPHRDLRRWPVTVDREGRGVFGQGRLHPDPDTVAAAALRPDAGSLGGGAGGAQGRGDRRAIRRGLRPVHALSHRMFRRFSHYIKTLGLWVEALECNKDKAIEVTDEVNYNRYVKYLRGCQYHFIDESIDVSLVTYLKLSA